MLKTKLHEKYFSESIKSKNMNVSKISKENILSSLIEFGRVNKFHVVYYVDSQTFHQEHKFSQQDQQKYIQTIHQECEEYASSMIIYDLDSIVEISKSYSGFKTDMKKYFGKSSGGISAPNFSYHIGKQDVLSMILEKFKSTSASKLKKTWMVLLVKHPYLKKMVKDNGFVLTDEENQILISENENPMKICKHCLREFNYKENRTMSCHKHRMEKFYFQNSNENVNVEIYSRNEMEQLVAKAEDKGIQKYFQQNVKYLCCGGGVYSNGCFPCVHEAK
jgi:hypothetical protein